MDVLLLLAIIAATRGVHFAKEGKFFKDYASKERSQSIKGISVILVILCHFCTYVKSGDSSVWQMVHSSLGQLVVAMFLFYSGYGIYLAAHAKGLDYIKRIPARALTVLARFDFAVILFLIVRLLTHRPVGVRQFLLSLLGWDGIGNSNWYIFAIIILYLCSYLAMRFLKNKYAQGVAITILSTIFVVVMAQFKAAYWFNTTWCYTIGFWWGILQEKIDKNVMRGSLSYIMALSLSGLAFFLTWRSRGESYWYYLASGVFFCVLVNFVLMKVKFGNNMLRFFGNHVFSIYILQRLAFMILGESHWVKSHVYVYFILSLLLTILLALFFEKAVSIIESRFVKLKNSFRLRKIAK